jgi:hypothetical protein
MTTGQSTRIEFEHPSSKVAELYEDPDSGITTMGVAAGSLSLADDFFDRLTRYLNDNPPTDMRDIAGHSVDAYHDLQRDAFNHQLLNPLGVNLGDFTDPGASIGQELQRGLLNEISEKKQQIAQNLHVLIAGVDSAGGHIYLVYDGDTTSYGSVGYHMVGSGMESARSLFIRNKYTTQCDIDDALLRVAEAKIQAEEAQGVGNQMDLIVMKSDGFNRLSDAEIRTIRDLQSRITDTHVAQQLQWYLEEGLVESAEIEGELYLKPSPEVIEQLPADQSSSELVAQTD